MKSPLPLAERDARIAALQQAMAEAGLDALLIAGKGHAWSGRGYVRYLTDFHLWSHDCLILLPLDGEPMLAVTSHAVARKIAERGWLTDAQGDYTLVRSIAEAIRAKGLATARIGTVGTDWILPAGRLSALRDAMPGARYEPADALLDAVRAIKSPLEIRQCRDLWSLMRAAMDGFEAALKPGLSQRAAVAEAVRVAVAGGGRDVLAFIGEAPDAYAPPEDIPLGCDGVLRLHLEICGESGHWCERTMTFAWRDPTPRERALLEAEVATYDDLRAAARPGMTLAGLSALYVEGMEARGFVVAGPSAHFDFHGQGLDGIEAPFFSSWDAEGTTGDAVLREGQVLSYHPRRPFVGDTGWLPDIHDNLLIGADGAERLSGDWGFHWRAMR
ncbi:MAG: aminopeptidase P family N-terminal domain-containing protein [Rhodobacteraceae bacterium]|jgi:Xaa-Pro aminopeptidase|nr:aminopeptidase P family N-terminal domain-containing protein [Paracoccaceae bacterium]